MLSWKLHLLKSLGNKISWKQHLLVSGLQFLGNNITWFLVYSILETTSFPKWTFGIQKTWWEHLTFQQTSSWFKTSWDHPKVADHEMPHQALKAFAALGGGHSANCERDLHRWLRGLWGVEVQTYTVQVPLQVGWLQNNQLRFLSIVLFLFNRLHILFWSFDFRKVHPVGWSLCKSNWYCHSGLATPWAVTLLIPCG